MPHFADSFAALQALGPKYTEIVLDHVERAASIIRLEAIRDHLIEEFHKKKAKLVRNRFKMNEATTSVYKQVLFLNRKCIHGLQTFPSALQCKLEDCMFRQIDRQGLNTSQFDLMSVYYHSSDPDSFLMAQRKQLAEFKPTDWELEQNEATGGLDSGALTNRDMLVLLRFEAEFLSLLRNTLTLLKKFDIQHGEISKEYNRTLKLFEHSEFGSMKV